MCLTYCNAKLSSATMDFLKVDKFNGNKNEPVNFQAKTSNFEPFILYKLESCIYLCKTKSSEALEIKMHGNDLSIKEINCKSIQPKILNSVTTKMNGDIIFGIFKLPLGYYLGIVTSSEVFPTLGASVKEIRQVELISIDNQLKPIIESDKSIVDNHKEAISMLQRALSTHSFYYSSSLDYDITSSIEKNYLKSKSKSSQRNIPTIPSYIDADDKFFWNLNISSAFIERGLGHWVTPVTNIWTSSRRFVVNDLNFSLSLISRRSCKRQGPRFLFIYFLKIVLFE